MKTWLRRLFGYSHPESLVKIHIHKASLLHNLNEFKKLCPQQIIAPVLKSNAYGHGIIEIATLLKDEVGLMIADSYFEARKLRGKGITTPLLIIGYVRPENMNSRNLKNISYTITSLDTLMSIKKPAKIHLKIDTGMHRQGILPEEIDEAIGYIKNNAHISLEGVCSHLAESEVENSDFTRNQIALWNGLAEKFQKHFPELKYIHISNTFGHMESKNIKATMSRLGIGLYGITRIKNLDLKPVLEMKTIITGIKKIKKGDSVGYNRTFTAENDMIIATLPLGYYEGLSRDLSNKGFVKVAGIDCPIVGRISMNITTIDISKIPQAKIGDEVQIISPNKDDLNSIESMAKLASKINYEISVKIPSDIRRIVV